MTNSNIEPPTRFHGYGYVPGTGYGILKKKKIKGMGMLI